MAHIAFQGAAEVPAAGPPDRFGRAFEHIDSPPSAFGAGIGIAEQQAGQEGQQTAKLYGEIAAQQAANNYQDQSGALIQDFLNKRGQEAMEAYPVLQDKLKQLRESGGQSLGLLTSQATYNNEVRRTSYYQQMMLGRHYDQESRVWAGDVDKATIANQLTRLGADPNNEELATDVLGKLNQTGIRAAQRNGLLPSDPSTLTDAQAEIMSNLQHQNHNLTLTHRIEALLPTDPAGAQQLFDANRDSLASDPHYDALSQRLRTHANATLGDAIYGSAAAGGGVPTKPSAAPPIAGDLADRIIGAESGGQDVKNPLSSASGPGQFLDSTWLSTIKSAAPDIAAGKSDGQLLALKGDKPLARQMVNAYAEENKATLAAQGLPTDDGALYLAHFLGAGGAAKVLSADPATPMRNLVAPEVLKANPNIAGMTAGGVRELTAQRVGAQAPPAPQSGPTTPAAQPPGMKELADAELQAVQHYEKTISAIEADPRGADNPEALQRARQRAEQELRSRTLDISARRQILQQQRDATYNKYMSQLAPGAVIGPDVGAEIAADPTLSATEKRDLYNVIQNRSKGTAEQELAVHGPGYFDVRRRMLLPQGDPDRISDPSQILSLGVPDNQGNVWLTDAGIRSLIPELSALKRDPDKVTDLRRLNEFFAGMRPQIDKSGILPGMPNDGLGQQKMYEFQAMVERKREAYIAAGKNPNDLLDPDKPDYQGTPEALKPFKRTMQQYLADANKTMGGGAEATAAFGPGAMLDPTKLNSLADLQAAVKANPELRAQAIALALEKGWIRNDAAPAPSAPAKPDFLLDQGRP